MEMKKAVRHAGTDTIKWVVKPGGCKTGIACLADLLQNEHKFTDSERAELILADVNLQHKGSKKHWKAMPPDALIKPIRDSEEKVQLDLPSLIAYFMLLTLLRRPCEALRVCESYGLDHDSPKAWLHAISALLSFTSWKRTAVGIYPTDIDAFLETAERTFLLYMGEVFDVLTDLADIKSDPLLEGSAAQFYQAVEVMLHAYTELGSYAKADSLWQVVGRGATPTAKRSYLKLLLKEGNVPLAHEVLVTIPEASRSEHDYRRVIAGYSRQGDTSEAEEVFDLAPPVTLPQEKLLRVGTATALLHGYGVRVKFMAELTPVGQAEMFLKGAEGVEKRLEELQVTQAASMAQSQYQASLVKTLTSLYQERPVEPSQEALAKYEAHKEANRIISRKVNDVCEAAGFPLELPEGFVRKPRTDLVSLLLKFYSKSLGAKRAKSLLGATVVPKHGKFRKLARSA